MSIDILREIVSTEEQAEEIEAQARHNAREIVASAKKDAVVVIGKAIEQGEIEAKGIVKAAEEKAVQDMKDIRVKTQAQCRELKESSGSKLKDAVDFIVGRVDKLSDR